MDAGTAVIRSSELTENFWKQVDDLANSLIANTALALKDNQFLNLQSAGTPYSTYRRSESKWTYTDYAISIPLMAKKRRAIRPTEWINYQISISNQGVPPGDDDRFGASIGPILHVSFWQVAVDFDEDGYHVAFAGATDDYVDIQDERLLVWEGGETDTYNQWTFSLSLLELTGEDDIRTRVIDPIGKLLAGQTAEQALPANLPGLIWYAKQESGNAQSILVARHPGR